mmetsp:Transcript_19380/g.58335  ORF Transcript_19380/g.58335 Transcript_19380/m.58335 type:complete len:273 (+) Transcript_19380:822-1640(+)
MSPGFAAEPTLATCTMTSSMVKMDDRKSRKERKAITQTRNRTLPMMLRTRMRSSRTCAASLTTRTALKSRRTRNGRVQVPWDSEEATLATMPVTTTESNRFMRTRGHVKKANPCKAPRTKSSRAKHAAKPPSTMVVHEAGVVSAYAASIIMSPSMPIQRQLRRTRALNMNSRTIWTLADPPHIALRKAFITVCLLCRRSGSTVSRAEVSCGVVGLPSTSGDASATCNLAPPPLKVPSLSASFLISSDCSRCALWTFAIRSSKSSRSASPCLG